MLWIRTTEWSVPPLVPKSMPAAYSIVPSIFGSSIQMAASFYSVAPSQKIESPAVGLLA
jgi:hypothetical protein